MHMLVWNVFNPSILQTSVNPNCKRNKNEIIQALIFCIKRFVSYFPFDKNFECENFVIQIIALRQFINLSFINMNSSVTNNMVFR